MFRQFSSYRVDVFSSVDKGLCAMVLCYDPGFVGRMDFYTGQKLPKSYFWHPTGTNDPRLIYMILAMPMTNFGSIMDTLRSEKPLALEMQFNGTLNGVTTDGYAGMLRVFDLEPVGEQEGVPWRALRPKVANARSRSTKSKARR